MRFVSVRDLCGKSAEVLRDLPGEREMVITNNGRPVAILAAVSESNVEESLAAFRRARAVDAVAAMQRRSASVGTDELTASEIETEITEIRRTRSR